AGERDWQLGPKAGEPHQSLDAPGFRSTPRIRPASVVPPIGSRRRVKNMREAAESMIAPAVWTAFFAVRCTDGRVHQFRKLHQLRSVRSAAPFAAARSGCGAHRRKLPQDLVADEQR